MAKARRDPADVPVHDAPIPAALRTRVRELDRRLRRAQPSPKVELDHADAWQLLVATILAARSNDRTINKLTPELFSRWPTPAALARAPQAAVEKVVAPSGFFRVKAKAIRATAAAVVADFDGQVPRTMAELCTLPGVGRKTANVVLNVAFGEPTMAVDTHVFRVANRTGLAPGRNELEVETQLLARVPERVDGHPAGSWGRPCRPQGSSAIAVVIGFADFSGGGRRSSIEFRRRPAKDGAGLKIVGHRRSQGLALGRKDREVCDQKG